MTIAKSIGSLLIVAFLGITGIGCATTGAHDDPLRNTKKLVTEGHVSLYENGAFKVQGSCAAAPWG